MKKTICTLLMGLAGMVVATAQEADDPFLRIGADITTWGEFVHLYEQNRDAALLPIGRQEYAALFVNYKLKAAEGRARGLDTTATYRDECRFYIDELTKAYLEDTTAIHRFAARERARMAEEVHAAHVLVSVRPNASPVDTLAAYARAAAARARVVAGEDFAVVAAECSHDPSARANGGDLGYFSALQMVQPFEDAAYATPVGEVSPVFRTRFGYHFVRVYDRRKAEGEVRVKHVMVLAPHAEAAAKERIDSIYDAIVNRGADFDDMARRHSDDRQSASRGGLMPWFSRGQILPQFAEAAFGLEADGDISRPVRTAAGWHVICRVGRRTMMPQDEFDSMIDRAKDATPALKRASFRERMGQLAHEYDFRWDSVGRDSLIGVFLRHHDAASRKAALEAMPAVRLATMGGEVLAMPRAAEFVGAWDANALPGDNAADIACGLIRAYEVGRLEDKYPDFRYACAEYRDGMLVFEVMRGGVWGATPDSSAVDSLYAAHPGRYSSGGGFEGEIYFCSTLKDAAKVRKLVGRGKRDKAAAVAMRVVEGPIRQGDIYDDFLWPIVPAPYVVVGGTVTNGSPKPLAECRGDVISDWQTLEDRKLVDALRAKFRPVQIIKI